jgi:hypothetical protein
LSSLNPINFVIKFTLRKNIRQGKNFTLQDSSHFGAIYLSMVISGKKIPKRVFALAGIPCASTPLYAEHDEENIDR